MVVETRVYKYTLIFSFFNLHITSRNVRDDANLNQLLVLANMESYNAILIEQGKPQSERLILLRNLAIRQMDTLASINLSAVSTLPGGDM